MNSLERVIQLGIELLDAHRIDDLMKQLFHPDCTMVMPGGEEIDFAGITGMFRMQVESFPDVKHELIDCVESGDRIAFISRVTGTHNGPLMLPGGPVPPTGKQVTWRACDVLTFRGNKIARWSAFLDLTGLADQLTAP